MYSDGLTFERNIFSTIIICKGINNLGTEALKLSFHFVIGQINTLKAVKAIKISRNSLIFP